MTTELATETASRSPSPKPSRTDRGEGAKPNGIVAATDVRESSGRAFVRRHKRSPVFTDGFGVSRTRSIVRIKYSSNLDALLPLRQIAAVVRLHAPSSRFGAISVAVLLMTTDVGDAAVTFWQTRRGTVGRRALAFVAQISTAMFGNITTPR